MSPKELLCAFVLSRLGSCNSLLGGCPRYLLSKLQKVQNNAARLIFGTSRSAHVLLCFILFTGYLSSRGSNTNCLCFKIISHQAPIYVSELLHLYTPSRQLRSSPDTRVSRIPSFRTKSSGQLSGTNSLFRSVILPLSVILSLLCQFF